MMMQEPTAPVIKKGDYTNAKSVVYEYRARPMGGLRGLIGTYNTINTKHEWIPNEQLLTCINDVTVIYAKIAFAMRLVLQLYLTYCLQNQSYFNVDEVPKPAVRATRNTKIGSLGSATELTDENDDPYNANLIHMCIRSVSYIESDRVLSKTKPQWEVIEGIGKTVLESLGEDPVGYDRTKLGDLMADLVVAASSEGRKHAKEIEHIKSYLCCYYEHLSNPEAKALALAIINGNDDEFKLPKATYFQNMLI